MSDQQRRRFVLDTRPLRHSPDFRRLWTGSSLSVIGGQMTSFAVTLQIYQTTRSTVAVGAVGLASALPLILLGLFGGSFADAVDRRRLVMITNWGSIVVSGLLATQAFLGLRPLWPLYTLVAVQSLLGAVGAPARRTFVPRLLAPDQVAAGAADTISVIFRATLVQVATPDGFRGRVTSVDFVVGAGGPQLGNFRAGAVGSLTSPAVSAVGGGLATVLGAGVLALALPALTRYRALTGDDAH
jgi:hypothetical protein